jgi:hypothetical protein
MIHSKMKGITHRRAMFKGGETRKGFVIWNGGNGKR